MIREHRITIIRIRQPTNYHLNEELQWLGNSLGLFSERDKERSCFRVFVELLKAAKNNRPMSSDEIALRTNLTRGTVVFHLNKLIYSGLVVIEKGGYLLRVGNLEAVIDEIQKDLNRTCENMKKIAKKVDEELRS